MNTECEYPMWFKDTESKLVVRFDGLTSGRVIEPTLNCAKGEYMDSWEAHNTKGWINVTDQYKDRKEVSSIGVCKFNFGGYIKNEHKADTQTIKICDAPKCQHEISFDDECKECDKLYKEFNRPKVSHYQSGGIEPIDYINSHNMNFNCGCVVKYITRNGKKDGECAIKDLKKAIDYINFEIERFENVQK